MRSSSAVIFCLLVASALAASSTKTKTTTKKSAATTKKAVVTTTKAASTTKKATGSTQAPSSTKKAASTTKKAAAPQSTQAPPVGCSPKTEAEMLKEIRVSLKCPDAAPTSCKCSGNGQKQFDCPGPEKTLWASTGKKCINATSDKDKTWAKHTWPYPANTADDCKGSSGTGANWEPGSYDCTKVKVAGSSPVTYKTHKFEKGYAGYNSKYNSEAWCTQPSCYVDPCTCNMKDFSASSWFKKQDGTKMYYSGMICGAKYQFKAALCSGKTNKDACEGDSGCKWTPKASAVNRLGMDVAKRVKDDCAGAGIVDACQEKGKKDADCCGLVTQTKCASPYVQSKGKVCYSGDGHGDRFTTCCSAPTTTAGPTTAAPTTAAVAKVKVQFTFAVLNFTKLTTSVKTAITKAVADNVLAGLGAGYTKDHVQVVLKAGSVIAEVHITPLQGTTVAALSTSMNTTKRASIAATMVTAVKAVPNIANVLTTGSTLDNLTVTHTAPVIMTPPSVTANTTAAATTKVPTPTSSDATQTSSMFILVATLTALQMASMHVL